VCEAALFAGHPDTFLGRMFGATEAGEAHGLAVANTNGDYLIDHVGNFSAQCFKAIIDFYKHGQIRCPPNVSISELKEACDFFIVPFSHESVKCDDIGLLLHQLSNEGAERQFSAFLDDVLIPAMALSASLGERECHIVCLSNEDTVDWDDDLPPRLGEQYAQVVHSTALIRFMKFHENRRIAKASMRRRGLQTVKIGFEGFPTFAEKIKRTEDGAKCEVVYNYEHRPFIQLAWEQEESKSRHVNFQTVRGRPVNTQHHPL
jgi:BTB/POZ domain-containing protein 10